MALILERGFHPKQRTQLNGRNATGGTDATAASIIAFWPLRRLRQPRLLRTFLAFIAFVSYLIALVASGGGTGARGTMAPHFPKVSILQWWQPSIISFEKASFIKFGYNYKETVMNWNLIMRNCREYISGPWRGPSGVLRGLWAVHNFLMTFFITIYLHVLLILFPPQNLRI